MTVVIVNKKPFSTVTYKNVVSITVSGANVIINDGSVHTYPIDDVKIMIA